MSVWSAFTKCGRCTHFKHDGYECSQFGCDCRVAVRCVECGRACHAGELYENGSCCVGSSPTEEQPGPPFDAQQPSERQDGAS